MSFNPCSDLKYLEVCVFLVFDWQTDPAVIGLHIKHPLWTVCVTVWWRLVDAVNITQPPTIYALRVCNLEVGVYGWHRTLQQDTPVQSSINQCDDHHKFECFVKLPFTNPNFDYLAPKPKPGSFVPNPTVVVQQFCTSCTSCHRGMSVAS